MTGRIIVALLMVGCLFGCGRPNPRDNFITVPDDDPRVNAAIEKAKATVQTFIVALQNPKPGQSSFSVKMRFADDKKSEHMWLTPVTYDGKTFHGTVNNEPVNVTSVKLGQKVSLTPAQISDWMYVENRKLVGGYTIRALREGMSDAEKAKFDKTVPFSLE